MFKKLLYGVLIGIGISSFFSFVFLIGLFKTWQFAASDKIFPTREVNQDIVIIAIDNDSINKIGRWPWDRDVFAEVLGKLQKGSPYVVGLDVSFLEEQNSTSDTKLMTALGDSGNVILASEAQTDSVLLPLPAFRQKADTGIVNIVPDPDGVARLAPLKVTDKDQRTYNHFTVEIVKKYFEKKGISTSPLSSIPNENGYLRINYAAPPGSFKTYSFADVLDEKVVPANFRDKIVLIGATAGDLHDNQITPLSGGIPMSGVEVHANIIQSILEQNYLHIESEFDTIATIFAVGITLAIILMFIDIFSSIVVTVVAVIVYVLYAILSFDSGVIRHLIIPPLTLATVAVADIIYRYFAEFRQRRYLRKILSHYLSDAVLSEILADPTKLQLGGVRQDLTVLFSDVVGFTSISEKLAPEDLTHILNFYLNTMTKMIFDNLGVLDKYIGDAIMAFWGAPLPEPDHAYLACTTALQMQKTSDIIKKEWEVYGVKDVDIKIGINSGDMVVGNTGSDVRFDYTVLGDNVNIGSRLEGINRIYGTKIIISQSTYEHVKDRVTVRKIDTVAVKGKAKGVVIYELRSLGKPDNTEKHFLDQFEIARKSYEEGQFKKALKEFEQFVDVYPDDNPAKTYISRLKDLIANRPQHWDPIFKVQTK